MQQVETFLGAADGAQAVCGGLEQGGKEGVFALHVVQGAGEGIQGGFGVLRDEVGAAELIPGVRVGRSLGDKLLEQSDVASDFVFGGEHLGFVAVVQDLDGQGAGEAGWSVKYGCSWIRPR
ncbi:MAG: hypothetical protein R3E96_01795 [Planctomycetota bacterium]